MAIKFHNLTNSYMYSFRKIWTYNQMALTIPILISNANFTENGNENRRGLTIALPIDYFPLVNTRDSAIDSDDWSKNKTFKLGIPCDFPYKNIILSSTLYIPSTTSFYNYMVHMIIYIYNFIELFKMR